MGLVPREESRRERVDDRLTGAVSQRECPRPEVEAVEGTVLAVAALEGVRSGQCQDDRSGVQQERDNHELAVANQVGKKAEEDDRYAETGQPLTGYDPQLS